MSLGAIFTLIGYLLDLLALIVLVRVIISWIPGINLYNPVIRVIRAIGDPILAPFRGLLPSFGGMLDLSPVLALIVLEVLAEVCFSLGANAVSGVSVATVVVAAVEQLLLTLMVIVALLVLLRLLLSLFNASPWHPLTRGIRAMARPFCLPFEGVAVRKSAVDLPAIVALVVYVVVFVAVRLIFDNLVLPLT
ncbi:MAG TPA: YggT family protein [Candidatus Binatia bacterium]|nr:YggT family protein [Candidatus Binatia bacterium]